MIWYFVAIIILIQSTSSQPDLGPEILRGAKRAKLIDSRGSGGEKTNALSLSAHQKRQRHNLYAVIPDLDQTHVTRVSESNKNGPYFWENTFSKSNTHVAWKAADEMKRKRSKVSIVEQVRIIQVDCAVLQRSLQSHQELRLVKDNQKGQDAYQTLENFLKRISYILICLFYPETHEKMISNGGFPYEMLWKVLVSISNTSIDELEYIILNFQSPDTPKKGKSCALMTQVLGILNFFFKNNLVQENVVVELIEKEPVKSQISSHIIDMFSSESFLNLDLQECLLKSKSTEHLIFVLKFFQEDFYRNVEFEILKGKIQHLVEADYEMSPEIYQTAIRFSQYSFGKDDGIYMGVKEILIKDIINHFDTVDFKQSFIKMDVTFSILYDMICFSIKYFSEIFKSFLGRKLACHQFSLKMMLSDSIMRWLRSSRELNFMGLKGLWVSEISFSQSVNQISVKQLKYWVPELNEEVNYFKDNFRCYFPNEFDNWEKIFEDSSLKRSKNSMCVPECVNKKYDPDRIFSSFGSNFKLKRGGDIYLNEYKEGLKYPPMLSKAFLEDIYLWINRLKILVEINRENQKIWIEIMKAISTEMDPNSTQDLQKWLKKSDFIPMVLGEISCNLRITQKEWEKIKSNMEDLNENILSLTHRKKRKTSRNFYFEENRTIQNDFISGFPSFQKGFKSLSSMGIPSKIKNGLIIPDINFGELFDHMKDCYVDSRRLSAFLF